jgi:hypothetical protein
VNATIQRHRYRILLAATLGALSLGLAGAVIASASPDLRDRARLAVLGQEFIGWEGVTRQVSPNDCGVAALHMVLREMGEPRRYEALRAEFRLKPGGASMADLKLAAERYGLAAEGWLYSPADIRSIPLPAIAFVHGNHFVVLETVETGGSVVVLDPARGRLRVSGSHFRWIWNGETLVFRHTASTLSLSGRGEGGVR